MEQQPKPSLTTLELCKITPSSSYQSEFSLPFTFLDLPFAAVPPTERILFYSLPADAPPFDSILQNLKNSLSITLSHFFPLAGNLVWPENSPEPFILYKPGDSVSLTVAQADAADFHRLSSDHIRRANESHFLVPRFPTSDANVAPILCLQITSFPGAGFSISIATNHMAVDGKSSTMFLKSWASNCNPESEPYLPTLDFDRTAAKDPAGLQRVFLKYINIFLPKPSSGPRLRLVPKMVIPDDVAGCAFELTRAHIDNLRKAAAGGSASAPRRLSTFVVAFAHVATCIAKAVRPDPKGKVGLSFPVDWRPRLGGSLVGENYFGNGVGGGCGPLVVEAGELLGEDGFRVLAGKVSDAVAEMEERVKRNEAVEKMDEFFIRWMSEMPLALSISVAGSPRFGIYELDFGWGRCKKVEVTSMAPNGMFSMAESRNGNGGVEVGLSLPQHAMNTFSSLIMEGAEV